MLSAIILFVAFFILMLSFIMLIVVIMSVVQSSIMQSAVSLILGYLTVFMLSALILIFALHSVFMRLLY
jgi:hypothetical protein